MTRMVISVRSRSGWTGVSLLVLAATVGAARVDAQTKAYVAAGAVTVFDTTTEGVVASIPAGSAPARVAITPDGTRAYVSNKNSDSVSVIDTATDTVVGTIPVGDSPAALAMAPNGQQLYVMVAGAIQVIDPATDAVVAAIPVAGSGGVAFTPDGSRAYVASGAISVIDTTTQTVVQSFFADSGSASAVAISPDGSRAYVTTNGTNPFGAGAGVAVVDTATNTVTDTIALGVIPGLIALAPDGSRAYVGVHAVWVDTGYGAGFIPGRTVAVIDTLTSAQIASIDLGAGGAAWFLQNTAQRVSPSRRTEATFTS
jgi:YVTN family beta-propeller protein